MVPGRRSGLRRAGGTIAVLLAGSVVTVAVDAWRDVGAAAQGARLARMTRSPQWHDGAFDNPLERIDGPAWTMLTRWVAGGDGTVPKRPPPTVPDVARQLSKPPVSGLRITWFGHSSLLVEIDGHRVLFDPVWSERCSPLVFAGPRRFHPPPLDLGELPRLDAVVISHDHYDHLDYQTITELGALEVPFLVPLGVGAHLQYWGIPPDRIIELDWWDTVPVGSLEAVATPARHFSGRSLLMTDQNATLWAGWILVGTDHRVFYSGDTAMFPGFSEIGKRYGPFDATMIEVGAYDALWADVHLGPEQAVLAHRQVGGAVLFPVHWGTFDLALHPWTEPMERTLIAARDAGVTVVTPKPGQSIEPAKAPLPAPWWPSVPFRTKDEAPVVSSGLSETDRRVFDRRVERRQ